jgi:hypothetical protein
MRFYASTLVYLLAIAMFEGVVCFCDIRSNLTNCVLVADGRRALGLDGSPPRADAGPLANEMNREIFRWCAVNRWAG